MANFLCKIAQVVLFLYCVTQTHIGCGKDNGIKLTRRSKPATAEDKKNKDSNFAIVIVNHSFCGAVWISSSCLLTAASCLDGKRNNELRKTENSLIKITVIQTEHISDRTSLLRNYKEIAGAAIAHPLYRRVDGMTIGYDLAVVRVNFNEDHDSGTLCKKDKPNPKLIALGLKWVRNVVRDLTFQTVWQWPLEKNANKNIAIVDNDKKKKKTSDQQGEEYFIDHRKQFTSYIIRPEYQGTIFTTNGYGGPILDKNNGRCILGIMNFAATKNGTYYITSTKVTPVINWIENTMKYLRNNTGQSKLTKLREKAGLKYRNLRGVNLDPIGSDNPPGITPGEPVHKKAKSQGIPGKPLRQVNPAQL